MRSARITLGLVVAVSAVALGAASAKHPEAKTGSDTGVLHEELAGGNLSWG